MARLTIEEAKALADEWEEQRDERDREPRAEYFADVSALDLIKMWETNKRLDGRKLSDWEFGCLVEAWCARFGCLPPDADASSTDDTATERATREPLPADDTMLRAPDVQRLTGISLSTIKRMVNAGTFPRPMRLGVRSIGWPASDVKAFVALLEEQRRRPRH